MAIYIPSKIRVGYQKRKGTYTGKLAYVTYFGPKGELRKEKSWSDWCTGYARNKPKHIPHDDYENTPTSGFVLNKKAGGYSSGWNHRQAYSRIYDPRGFEFEITVDNLLYILEHVDCTRGKGLEGNFVYGWDRGDLILIPEAAPEYKEHIDWSNNVNKGASVKTKDLVLGAKYLTNQNKEAIYLGRFDYYNYDYNDYNSDVRVNKGKHYFFIVPEVEQSWRSDQYIITKSISKRIVKAITDTAVDNYSSLMDDLEKEQSYSPYDPSKDKYVPAQVSYLKKHDSYVFFDLEGIPVKAQVGVNEKDNLFLYSSVERVKPVPLIRDIWGRTQDSELREAEETDPDLFRKVGYWGEGVPADDFISKYKPKRLRRFQANGQEIK